MVQVGGGWERACARAATGEGIQVDTEQRGTIQPCATDFKSF